MSENINEFDNEKSTLYKWSISLEIPPELVIVEKVRDENIYHSGIEKIQEYLQTDNNIINAHEKFPSISIQDLAMIYTLYNFNKLELSKIVEDINSLYSQENVNVIRNGDELKLRYEEWAKKLKDRKEEILDEIDEINYIHETLSKYKSLDVTDLKVTNITVSANFSMLDDTGKYITPSIHDGIEIFNNSNANKNMPYIKYNSFLKSESKNLQLFKIYKGKIIEELPNYKNIIPETDYKEEVNNFVFIFWSGEGDIQKATKESFLKGVYDLPTNTMLIKIHSGDKDQVKKIVNQIGHSLSIKPINVKNTYISGEFSIYDVEIKKLILSDMIFNNDILKNYFYIKETTTPLIFKKKFKIFYRSEKDVKSSLNFSIEQKYTKTDEHIKIKGEDVIYPSNTPYLKVIISKADNIKTAEQFINIFSRLMMYYKDNYEKTENIYKTFIPELNLLPERKELQVITSGSRIKQLKFTAPDIFVTDYARKCQKNSQPIIIPPDELDNWEYKMAFPPDKPEIYIGCPDANYPHPGVIINDGLSNKDKYPCLPCCFKDDQMSPNVNSNYNKCYGKGKEETEEIKEVEKKEKKITEGHVIITGKIIKPGRYGDLPEDIQKLLSSYNGESGTFYRKGVPHTENSFIHCLSDAIDPKYKKSKNKEKYVSNIREKIYKNTRPSLLKQELYDYSDEDIMNKLKDTKIFLDPNKYYRALEEYYNVNIYVFGPTTLNKQGEMVLPRFKLFYSKVPRDRDSVLIYRSMGSESDVLKFAQCELIIENKKKKNTQVFGEQMSKYLHKSLLKLNRIITWELVSDNNKIDVLGRDNIYSVINYFDMISKKGTKQLIDGYGKLRGLIFPSNGEQITIMTHSSQPENLDSTTDIIRCTEKTSIKTFGDPMAVTLNENNLVNGHWYQVLDIVYGIYIPIIPQHENKGYTIGPPNPYNNKGPQIVSKIKKLEGDLNYIKQILIWLFSLSNMDNPTEFMEEYTLIDENVYDDSENIYDFSNIGFRFPKVNNINSAFNKLEKRVPTIVENNKLYIYSEKFYDGLKYFLNKYNHEYSPIKVPTEIYRTITSDDFTKQPYEAVFVNEHDLKTWLNTMNKMTYKNIIIDKKLSLSNEVKIEPYIYSDPDGNTYMIQNVVNGDLLRAINVANYWKLNKINLGFNSEHIEEKDVPNHVIYIISPSFNPILSKNNAGDSTDYIQILSYRHNKYAAMIKLV